MLYTRWQYATRDIVAYEFHGHGRASGQTRFTKRPGDTQLCTGALLEDAKCEDQQQSQIY